MGVAQSHILDDGLTPICNECGVALCWDISEFEYKKDKEFWDEWQCQDCNPNYKGALKRFQNLKTKRR